MQSDLIKEGSVCQCGKGECEGTRQPGKDAHFHLEAYQGAFSWSLSLSILLSLSCLFCCQGLDQPMLLFLLTGHPLFYCDPHHCVCVLNFLLWKNLIKTHKKFKKTVQRQPMEIFTQLLPSLWGFTLRKITRKIFHSLKHWLWEKSWPK